MDDKQDEIDEYWEEFFAPASPQPIYKSNKKQVDPDQLLAEVKRLLNKSMDELLFVPKKKKEVKCECGGEKAGTPHSHWCPIAKEQNDAQCTREVGK